MWLLDSPGLLYLPLQYGRGMRCAMAMILQFILRDQRKKLGNYPGDVFT